jgi:hypothetical protein
VSPRCKLPSVSDAHAVLSATPSAAALAVRELSGANVDVLLLDRNQYKTFQPLLYQGA